MSVLKQLEEIQKNGYEFHHVAGSDVHVSNASFGYLVPYEGKFGKGYKWYMPTWGAGYKNRHVAYYIKEGK